MSYEKLLEFKNLVKDFDFQASMLKTYKEKLNNDRRFDQFFESIKIMKEILEQASLNFDAKDIMIQEDLFNALKDVNNSLIDIAVILSESTTDNFIDLSKKINEFYGKNNILIFKIQNNKYDAIIPLFYKYSDVRVENDKLSVENKRLSTYEESYRTQHEKQLIEIKTLKDTISNQKETISKNLSEGLITKFSERAGVVNTYKKNMSYALLGASIVTALATWYTLSTNYLLIRLDNNASGVWLGLFVRISLLLVTYIVLFFIMRQYNKEREIEESYRFKEAIAFSIPKYREIANDDIVKDRLLEESARVIFEHPHERKQKIKEEPKQTDLNESLNFLQKAGDIFKNFGKTN